MCKYLFAGNDALLPHVAGVLGTEADSDAGIDAAKLLRDVEELVAERWRGEPREVLVDVLFSPRTAYQDSADASKEPFERELGRDAGVGVEGNVVIRNTKTDSPPASVGLFLGFFL